MLQKGWEYFYKDDKCITSMKRLIRLGFDKQIHVSLLGFWTSNEKKNEFEKSSNTYKNNQIRTKQRKSLRMYINELRPKYFSKDKYLT
jgi:hypothetical protein